MKKILVVDDDEAILDVVTIVLSDEGYSVTTLTTGETLYKLTNPLPDLIILDILLSGEDGRDICRHLKSNDATQHIPIILFSAHSHGDIYTQLPHHKYDYFLSKPFDVDDLIRVVKSLVP